MNINVQPHFFCNFRCEFCYLGTHELSDPKRLDLKKLRKMLFQIPSFTRIEIFGGEVSLLPVRYMLDLFELIAEFSGKDIYVLLNGSVIPWWIHLPHIKLGFSYDYTCRKEHWIVEENLRKITKPFAVSMVATRCILEKDHKEIINAINSFPMAHSFEIKHYLPNLYNHQIISDLEYETYIRKIIEDKHTLKVPFYNEDLIKFAIDGKDHDDMLDKTVFITPNGKWGKVDFLEDGRERMVEYEELEDCLSALSLSINKMKSNKYCSKCKYLGRCFSEAQEVKSIEKSCRGHKKLIDWYDANKK